MALPRLSLAVALLLIGGFLSPTLALEKNLVRVTEDPPEWTSSATCPVSYYNVCMGWAWSWTDWAPSEGAGVVFEACATGDYLESFTLFTTNRVSPGWGYTGTLGVYPADENDCPSGSPIWSSAFLPNRAGWQTYSIGTVIPERFIILATQSPWGGWNMARFRSDYTGTGPNGPMCGVCFPEDRAVHSYWYGTSSSPLCPGIPEMRGPCHTELLWIANIIPNPTTGADENVEHRSWSTIKSLYR